MWISGTVVGGVCVCVSLLPESAGSDVGVDVGVPVTSTWLLCSESGEEAGGVEESAELATDEELEGGGAVTVDDDPEEEEEVDLGMAAAAGPADTSGAFVPMGLSGVLDSWLEPPAGAAGVCDAPSGRTAVPGTGK